MTTLLQINSSIHNGNGQSSQLANRFVAAFRERNPDARFITVIWQCGARDASWTRPT